MGTKYSSSFLKTGSNIRMSSPSASEWKSNVDQASSPAGGIRTDHNYFILLGSIPQFYWATV